MLPPVRTLVLTLGAALLVALWLALDGGRPASRRFALSPQQCNTECQSRQTDCILACDGDVSCGRHCTEAGTACVRRCRGDAGGVPEGRSERGGGAGRPGH